MIECAVMNIRAITIANLHIRDVFGVTVSRSVLELRYISLGLHLFRGCLFGVFSPCQLLECQFFHT